MILALILLVLSLLLILFICIIAIRQGWIAAAVCWALRFVFVVMLSAAHHYELSYAVAPAVGAAVRRGDPIWEPGRQYWTTEEGRLHVLYIQVLGLPLLRLNPIEISSQRSLTNPWHRFHRWDAPANSLVWGIALTAMLEFAIRCLVSLSRRLLWLRRVQGPSLRNRIG